MIHIAESNGSIHGFNSKNPLDIALMHELFFDGDRIKPGCKNLGEELPKPAEKSKEEIKAEKWREYQNLAIKALKDTDGEMLKIAELMFMAGHIATIEKERPLFTKEQYEFVKWRLSMREIVIGEIPKNIPSELPACPLV